MNIISLTLLLIVLMACNDSTINQNVGDLTFDKSLDDPNFRVCNEDYIHQYYTRNSTDKEPEYKGEKPAIKKAFFDSYNFPTDSTQNGWITIRFVVNCQGESGRFRVEQIDENYKLFEFNSTISQQLLAITKSLNSWVPRKRDEQSLDFYQYLTFKIRDGQLKFISP